jgi:uncharacterized SAM-binding protein YcdF (DUF218 family)
MQQGVAARSILREWQSGDTIGNAVFVRRAFFLRAKF